jgi:hypothetical protein
MWQRVQGGGRQKTVVIEAQASLHSDPPARDHVSQFYNYTTYGLDFHHVFSRLLIG